VADNAVFYLNGVEVYRQNHVSTINYSGPIAISVSNLVLGANVLAVEVHQATGSADSPVFGTELTYSASAEPPFTLAFNDCLRDEFSILAGTDELRSESDSFGWLT
jgi:hypothetical protein